MRIRSAPAKRWPGPRRAVDGDRAATFQYCGPGPRSTKQTPSAQGHLPRYLPPRPTQPRSLTRSETSPLTLRREISPAAGDITLGRAADAYLATLRGAEQENTRCAYGRVLRRMTAEFGSGTAPEEISAELLASWFGGQWGERAPSTWGGT